MPSVHFFQEDVDFHPSHPRKTVKWIKETIAAEGHSAGVLNFIFCSDQYLLDLNIQYLKHRTLTDIITFDHSDSNDVVQGDIYISIDRVRENSRQFEEPFDRELHRVMIHGVLHLLGYNDKSPANKRVMRKKEDAYLSLRH